MPIEFSKGYTINPLDLPMVAQTFDYTCGAACFESMYLYSKKKSPGELHFARELGVLDLGFTPPINIVNLAKDYGFNCMIKEGAQIEELQEQLLLGKIIFVTWWYEDSGHYSLVKHLDENSILLMDPWTAREGLDHHLKLTDFIPNWEARGALIIAVG